jgi:hypothetical protein
MVSHATRVALVTTAVLGLATTSCGAEKPTAATVPTALTACRSQWRDVARSVTGLDQDTDPSALATRWTSVLATVDYYETTQTAKNCQENIETQLEAITALRDFSARLRPYDMEYQADLVAPDVGRYLADPLPAATRNKNGKPVLPPSKAAVTAALNALRGNAAAAHDDLQPGWAQLASVELKDGSAVTTALQDLEFLAKDSPTWVTCNNALVVIGAAIRAQNGLGPDDPLPTSTPSATPTP